MNSIIKDPTLGEPFSRQFNEKINQKMASQHNDKGWTPGQIQAFNLFFEKYVPGLEGICFSCFKVMLPRSGSGERWLHQDSSGAEYEVRLSAAKSLGFPSQQSEYVSQTITDINKARKFAMWDTKKCEVVYSNSMKQGPTHIPWPIYDYNKFILDMPICKCK